MAEVDYVPGPAVGEGGLHGVSSGRRGGGGGAYLTDVDGHCGCGG